MTACSVPRPRSSSQWTGFARIDWQAAERHRFTLEGIGAHWNSPGGGLTRVSENYGNHSFRSSQASQAVAACPLGSLLTPNLLAVTQGSAGRTIQTAQPETPSAFEQTFLAGTPGASCRRSSWTRATASPSAIPRASDRAAIPTNTSTTLRSCWTGSAASCWSKRLRAQPQRRRHQPAAQPDRHLYYSNVENFVSDALVFESFGLAGARPVNQHNCDQTGKSGATQTAICADSATCPATPTTRRPWAPPTGI